MVTIPAHALDDNYQPHLSSGTRSGHLSQLESHRITRDIAEQESFQQSFNGYKTDEILFRRSPDIPSIVWGYIYISSAAPTTTQLEEGFWEANPFSSQGWRTDYSRRLLFERISQNGAYKRYWNLRRSPTKDRPTKSSEIKKMIFISFRLLLIIQNSWLK